MRAGRGHWLLALLLAGCAETPAAVPAISPALQNWTDGHGIAGFEKLRWGMKEAEIRQLYPEIVEAFDARLGNPREYRHLQIRDHDLAGCRYSVNLAFFNGSTDELTTIQFAYSGTDVATCASQLKADLHGVFGDGKVDAHESVRYTGWYGPQLEIMVDEVTAPNGGKSLSVNYTHTHALGTYIE